MLCAFYPGYIPVTIAVIAGRDFALDFAPGCDEAIAALRHGARAVDKNTGAVKWTSKDFGGALAEMKSANDVLYGRLGGAFYDFGRSRHRQPDNCQQATLYRLAAWLLKLRRRLLIED